MQGWIIKTIEYMSPIKIPLLYSVCGFSVGTIISGYYFFRYERLNQPVADQNHPSQNVNQNYQPKRRVTRSESPEEIVSDESKNQQKLNSFNNTRRKSNSPNSNDPSAPPLMAVGRYNYARQYLHSNQQQQTPPDVVVTAPEGDNSKSSGETTRQSLYKLLFLALLSRLIALPLEGATIIMEFDCSRNPLCIVSRTFSEIAFASAFSLMVLFYVELAGTASVGPHGLSLLLTQKTLFRVANAIIYITYTILSLLTFLHPLWLPAYFFERLIWLMLTTIYLLLFLLLAYFGPILVFVLRPSLAKWSGLALRLTCMCILLSIIFISRALAFGLACAKNDLRYTCGFLASHLIYIFYSTHDVAFFFGRDVIGYTLYELLPSLAILLMMHRSSSSAGRYSSTNSLPSSASNTPPGNALPIQTAAATSSSQYIRRNMSGSAPKNIHEAHRNIARYSDENRPLLDKQIHRTSSYGVNSEGV